MSIVYFTCVCVCVCAHVSMCMCLGRQNSSTRGSFPGSHRGWNNAALTSTGFCRIFATCWGRKYQVLRVYLHTCTYSCIGNVWHLMLYAVCMSGGRRGREENKFLSFKSITRAWLLFPLQGWRWERGKQQRQGGRGREGVGGRWGR